MTTTKIFIGRTKRSSRVTQSHQSTNWSRSARRRQEGPGCGGESADSRSELSRGWPGGGDSRDVRTDEEYEEFAVTSRRMISIGAANQVGYKSKSDLRELVRAGRAP